MTDEKRTTLVKRMALWPNTLLNDRRQVELALPEEAHRMVEQVIEDAYRIGKPQFDTLHFGLYPANEEQYPNGTEVQCWITVELRPMPDLPPLPSDFWKAQRG